MRFSLYSLTRRISCVRRGSAKRFRSGRERRKVERRPKEGAEKIRDEREDIDTRIKELEKGKAQGGES
jgi:hypothetical protein